MKSRLVSGAAAPDFTYVGSDGNDQRLSDLRGRKVLLAFFRNAACALCNLRVRQFILRYHRWQQQGLEVLAVFESPDLALSQHVGKQEAPFPVFADPHAEIYDRYGVEVSEDKFQATIEDADTPSYIAEAAAAGFVLQHQEGANMHRVPAEFLIDESGTIQIAHYGRLMTDHLSLEVIDRFARGTENDQL
ncbi:peroxiredoxin family protein [Brevibacillus choshinensis]|uniref:thioredoxin-dependent peroxiredoxin n=1 Tax=Brevibacillus choshinensis TaxID=54911 RepID=A0ABX7FSN3_BRECH|nr:redoxin domain-containing protein [Brevibacillus choshinensis]QRG68714.1 redoxin domain-containing protein [Brevibacillus choshinensis]